MKKLLILSTLFLTSKISLSQDTLVTKWNDKFPCYLVKIESKYVIVSKTNIPFVTDSIKYPISTLKCLIVEEKCGLHWKTKLDTITSSDLKNEFFKKQINSLIDVEDYLQGTLINIK